MNKCYDTIVLGVGGMGSATAAALSQRGVSVLGIEQFGPAHDRGSSHGETRAIRKAYFEHPDYVPLLHRAYDLWKELERESGQELYRQTGLMLAGPGSGDVITGALGAADQHSLPIEQVEPSDLAKRFPCFRFREDHEVVFEPEAGFLHVERCVASAIQRAEQNGTQFLWNEPASAWHADSSGVTVKTPSGSYSANSLVIAAGPWANKVVLDLGVRLQLLRKTLHWHEIGAASWLSGDDACTFYFEHDFGHFYGFPSLDGKTVKLAEHSGGEPIESPEELNRDFIDSDRTGMLQFLDSTAPDFGRETVRHATCMYTVSPDSNFIIDQHPHHENVVLAAGMSGHGFKFASVIGEICAELVIDGTSQWPIEFLRLSRFGTKID